MKQHKSIEQRQPWEQSLVNEAEKLEVHPASTAWIKLETQLRNQPIKRSKPIYRIIYGMVAAAAMATIWLAWPSFYQNVSPHFISQEVDHGQEVYYTTWLATAQHIAGYTAVGEGSQGSTLEHGLFSPSGYHDSLKKL